jgi:hypothetical protein
VKGEILAVVAVSLIIASALAGYFEGSATIHRVTTATATTTLYLSGCPTSVRFPNATRTTGVQAYQMSPGSIGVMCINYHFDTSGNYSFAPADYGPYTDMSFSACNTKNYPNGSVPHSCTVLRITPSPTSFDHTAGQSIAVTYAIQADGGATGVYWFFIANCNPIPLVIGSIPASLTYPPVIPCTSVPDTPNSANVTAVFNINVVMVPSG